MEFRRGNLAEAVSVVRSLCLACCTHPNESSELSVSQQLLPEPPTPSQSPRPLEASASSKQQETEQPRSESRASLLDYDDCCPTCLEPYTPENPKIVAKCGHHFHLPCIYDWLERSPTCPICGKKMEFDVS